MISDILKHNNLFLSGFSYLRSNFSGKATISGMPVTLGIELTNICNLQCPECPSGSGILTRDKGFMSVELFDKIICELGPFLYNVNLYFQGEPMMHPQVFLFLSKISHIHSVLSTNGHFLSAENSVKLVTSGLKKLVVSVDGTDQETYSTYRKGGDLDKVKKGILNVAEAKKHFSSRLKIEIQFLVNRSNEHQIPEMIKYAGELNASLKLKSMQIINKENAGNWLPAAEKYSRYYRNDRDYKIKNRLPDRCMRLWFNPVITWDGKVVPCCFDKDANHIMGDLNIEPFSGIWTGSKYQEFRNKVLAHRNNIEICRNCTSGLKRVIY